MTLLVPPQPAHEVDLVIEATLAGRTREERLQQRFGVHGPYVFRVTLEQMLPLEVDPRIVAALPAEDDYFVLAFSCAYHPTGPDGDDAPFVDSRIAVQLTSPNGIRQPVAHALSPDKDSTVKGHTFNIALGLPLEIVDASVEYATAGSRVSEHVIAAGRGGSTVSWTLASAPERPLTGDIWLSMVVGAPAGAQVTASVRAGASLRRLKILRSRAALPDSVRTIDLRALEQPAVFAHGPAGELPAGTA